jgi:hypothetical protein
MAFPYIPAPVNDPIANPDGIVRASWQRFFLQIRNLLGAIASGLTSGSVTFGSNSGVITQNPANFFWDDTNKRLGILTNAPATTLDVTNAGLIRAGGFGAGGVPGGTNRVDIFGATSGRVSLRVPAAAGANILTLPAGTTNFAATGGANQVVQQSGAGSPFTVGQLATGSLSDYGVGSWTPTLTFGGLSTGITYALNSGSVVRIGNLLFISFQITLTSKGTATGAAVIGGLPATALALPFSIPICQYINMVAATGLIGQLTSASVNLVIPGATGTVAANDTNFTNNSVIQGSGCYQIP